MLGFGVVVLTGVTVGLVLALTPRGLELTDEGYYLVWMNDPFRYPASTSQFGFVLHPLYQAAGGDIAALRAASVTALVTLSAILGLRVGVRAGLSSAPVLGAVASATGLASLAALGPWLPTPSYNTLAVLGFVLAAIALTLTDRRLGASSTAGWVLLGVSGWATFMARPPSAAVLAALVLLSLAVRRQLAFRPLALAASTSLLLVVVSAVVIDGSVPRFVDRLVAGAELRATLDPRLTILGMAGDFVPSLLDTPVTAEGLAVLLGCAGMSGAGVALAARSPRTALVLVWLGTAVLAAAAAGHLLATPPTDARTSQLLLGSAAVGLAAGAFLAGPALREWSPRRSMPQALLLALAPLAFAFGSAFVSLVQASYGSVLWVVAALLVVLTRIPPARRGGVAVVAATAVVLAAAVYLSLVTSLPYRQDAPLADQARPTPLESTTAGLLVSPRMAGYLAAVHAAASEAGWTPGTPMIDLTGKSPATVHSLGAVSLGDPWLLGGYPGSTDYAVALLASEECGDLSRAWLLTAPNTPRALPEAVVLASFGADLTADYTAVGAVTAPDGTSQVLYRPRARGLDESCRTSRESDTWIGAGRGDA